MNSPSDDDASTARSGAAQRRVVATASIGLILLATLIPSGGELRPFSYCVLCGDFGAADNIANVLLFIPFGAAISAFSWRPFALVVCAALLSTSIELTQASLIAGRQGNLGDILFNTAGGALGIVIARTSVRWLNPDARLERLLGWSAVLAAFGVVIATRALTSVSLPSTSWFGQWTPQFGDMAYYDGRVLDARSGGRLIPSRRLGDGGALRRDILAHVPLIITATASPATPGFAAIFSVADEQHRRLLIVGADGSDLAVYLSRRASDALFHEPVVRVRNALRGVRPGDTLVIEVRLTDRGICVGVVPRVACGVGVTAGGGWQLLAPLRVLQRHDRLADAVWIGLLFVPVGYWVRARWSVLATLIVVCGVAPLAFGLIATTIAEWVGAFAGAGFGIALRRAYRGPA